MKPNVLDIMKFNLTLLSFFVCGSILVWSQSKQEREFKIDVEAFPNAAKELLEPFVYDVKRVKYYKEFDGKKLSYEAKFKKDKLRYSVEFDKDGKLEDVEFIIKKVDIPKSSLGLIAEYLEKNHLKYRIKKIQQQHLNSLSNPKKVLKEAFQNLILPTINYELIVSSKSENGFLEYEITFDSLGKHLLTRNLVKPKYDHILY